MNLNVRPQVFALRHSPTGAILVTLQVAITLAVLVNAAWLVSQRIGLIRQPAGLDVTNTFAIDVTSLSENFNITQAENEDVAYLRGLPGVAAVTLNIGIPLTGTGSFNPRLWRQPGQRGTVVRTNVLSADDQTLRTLGISLVAGRNFRATETQPQSPGQHSRPSSGIIVTQALAHALFPRRSALGKTIYDDQNNPLTIIGITGNFIGAPCDCGIPLYHTALFPRRLDRMVTTFSWSVLNPAGGTRC